MPGPCFGHELRSSCPNVPSAASLALSDRFAAAIQRSFARYNLNGGGGSVRTSQVRCINSAKPRLGVLGPTTEVLKSLSIALNTPPAFHMEQTKTSQTWQAAPGWHFIHRGSPFLLWPRGHGDGGGPGPVVEDRGIEDPIRLGHRRDLSQPQSSKESAPFPPLLQPEERQKRKAREREPIHSEVDQAAPSPWTWLHGTAPWPRDC